MESTLTIERPAINITQRLHGIDALRGIAMILGVVLHATIAYKAQPLPTWPNDPGHSHWGFDYLYLLIHSFRMPLFFLIAGYFARFLYYRIGEKAFIKHRAKRILLPFIGSMLIILPLTYLPFMIYTQGMANNWDWEKTMPAVWQNLFTWKGMAHLWFLYYMLFYYAVMVVILKFSKPNTKVSEANQSSSKADLFRVGSWVGVLATALPAFALLALVPELFLHVDTGILPSVPYLLFFGYFFLLGWFINRSATQFFTWVTEKAWMLLGLGIFISIGMFVLEYSGRYESLQQSLFLMTKFAATLQVMLLVFGSVGFFLKYCHSESALWKYISDASYWMYLIHLALVAGFQVLFLFYDVPGIIKFVAILLLTIMISLITYHYVVRYSWLGELMHGRREKKIAENGAKTGFLFFKKM